MFTGRAPQINSSSKVFLCLIPFFITACATIIPPTEFSQPVPPIYTQPGVVTTKKLNLKLTGFDVAKLETLGIPIPPAEEDLAHFQLVLQETGLFNVVMGAGIALDYSVSGAVGNLEPVEEGKKTFFGRQILQRFKQAGSVKIYDGNGTLLKEIEQEAKTSLYCDSHGKIAGPAFQQVNEANKRLVRSLAQAVAIEIARNHFVQGEDSEQLFQSGDLSHAADVLITTVDPNSFNQMPLILTDSVQFQKVSRTRWREMAEAIKKASPSSPHARSVLSKLYQNLGAYPESAEALKRALERDENNPYLHYQLGEVFFSEHDLEKACVEFGKAWKLLPGDDPNQNIFLSRLYSNLGIYLVNMGWFAPGLEALQWAERHSELKDEQSILYLNFLNGKGVHHGAASFRYHRTENKKEWTTVIRRSPAWVAGIRAGDKIPTVRLEMEDGETALEPLLTHAKLGDAISMNVERDHSIRDFDIKLDWEIARKKAGALNDEGLMAAQKKDFNPAFEKFKQAIQFDFSFGQAYFNLALIDEMNKHHDQAFQDYLNYLALDPEANDVSAVREKVRHLQTKISGAPETLFPADVRDLMMEGNAWAKNQNYARAIFAYVRALEVSPGYASLYRNNSAMFEALELYDTAAKLLQQYLASSLDSDDELEAMRQHWMDILVKTQK